MSDHNATASDGTFINSIVGEGTKFRGELDLAGLLRIDGDFFGSIKTDGKVLVGRNGRAECTIRAATVVVGGVVRGNIFSTEKVIILSTGMVIGNISTQRLIVEEGVVLNGSCLISREVAGEAPAKSVVPSGSIASHLDDDERKGIGQQAEAPFDKDRSAQERAGSDKDGLPLWNR